MPFFSSSRWAVWLNSRRVLARIWRSNLASSISSVSPERARSAGVRQAERAQCGSWAGTHSEGKGATAWSNSRSAPARFEPDQGPRVLKEPRMSSAPRPTARQPRAGAGRSTLDRRRVGQPALSSSAEALSAAASAACCATSRSHLLRSRRSRSASARRSFLLAAVSPSSFRHTRSSPSQFGNPRGCGPLGTRRAPSFATMARKHRMCAQSRPSTRAQHAEQNASTTGRTGHARRAKSPSRVAREKSGRCLGWSRTSSRKAATKLTCPPKAHIHNNTITWRARASWA